MAMLGKDQTRQRTLYWAKMLDLKVAAGYVELYRDSLRKWVAGISTVRAIASCSSIAAWAIWSHYAFLWGAIIACSQVLDALRDVFPIAKRHKAASMYAIALDRLFIDAQLEWEDILAGKYTNEQISKRLHKLRMLHRDAETRSFPDGGPPKKSELFLFAEKEGQAFFRATYGVDFLSRGDGDETNSLESSDDG